MKERIRWIDFLRGISMILILVFHTEVYYKEYNYTPYYIYTSNAIILFYFISGYLFYRPEVFSLKKKATSIVRSLLVPYFIFTTLIAIPKVLVRNESIDWIDIIINILSGRASWFIAALIIGELFFALLLTKTRGKTAWLLTDTIACFIIYYLIPFNEHNYWQWQDALLAVVFLYLGYFYHQHQDSFHTINKPLYSLLLLLILIFIKVYEYHVDLPMRNIAIENVPLFLADALIWLLFIISIIRYIPRCKIIEWTGQHCIVYYFLCGGCPLIVSMTMNKLGIFYDGYLYRYILTFLFVYLMATMITWLIYKFMPFITAKKTLFIAFLCCNTIAVKAQTDYIALPELHIQTVDGEMPTCTIVYAPEGCSGVSITDNNYVPGRMVMTLGGETLYDSKEYVKGESGMRIKIRGNSTGAYLGQHPYKIKLSKKYDLLRRDNKEYKHKEWLLMSMYTWNSEMTNQESNILYMTGLLVNKIVDKEWTPEYDFVNVYINDQYQGMYYLMESVSKGEKRVNISDTGFLIEHDTFWWNEDIYFKTNNQNNTVGFTYKYPDKDDLTESIQTAIINFMNDFENALYSNGNITEYIDMESFAKWILIHDILGTTDAAGCNRFLFKYDMNDNNPQSSKLGMGPTWDYDSSFKSQGWSTIHDSYDSFYFPKLFEIDYFKNVYLQVWQTIRPTILSDIQSGFSQIWDKYGAVFDKSMKLHQTVYPNEGHQLFQSQIEEVIEKLTQRIYILDELMKQYEGTNHIDNIPSDVSTTSIFDIQGRHYHTVDVNTLPKGVYILQNHQQKSKIISVR